LLVIYAWQRQPIVSHMLLASINTSFTAPYMSTVSTWCHAEATDFSRGLANTINNPICPPDISTVSSQPTCYTGSVAMLSCADAWAAESGDQSDCLSQEAMMRCLYAVTGAVQRWCRKRACSVWALFLMQPCADVRAAPGLD